MLALEDLSKIGFGGYNVSLANPEHHDALVHALRLGCNLVDTASTYMDGESEALVGRCIREIRREVFILTKAGYVQGQAVGLIEQLQKEGLPGSEVVNIAPGFRYSLHPLFLTYQMARSRERLKVDQIDGFLLHNPEHLFETGPNVDPEELYCRISRAFEFLEDEVALGRLRYYGVSSNTLPQSTERPDNLDVRRLLACAQKVSSAHHFKLLQFPFNLLEQEAIAPHHGGTSLIAIAHQNGLVTFGNRPLNAKLGQGSIRLATYDEVIVGLDEAQDAVLFAECVELVRERLHWLGVSAEPFDFAVLRLLNERWMCLPGPETVEQLFHAELYPFVEHLYEGKVPNHVRQAFLRLQQQAQRYARRTLSERARDLKQRLVQEGQLPVGDDRPLPAVVCERYLTAGLDHVLVGMRTPRYVDDLRSLLPSSSSTTMK